VTKLAVLLDERFKRHLTGAGHPERPERYDAVMRAADASGVLGKSLRLPPRAATDDELALVHEARYLRTVEREVMALAGKPGVVRDLSTGDVTISAGSLEVARLAAGGCLNAVDALFEDKAQRAFAAVRPPGHHATPARGMGFCLFNNVAVAARYAQKKYGVDRVLIADWDVHHGNGTQDTFYADGSVMFFSTHQHPWYPGTGSEGETGEGKGKGKILNAPLPAGSGREEVLGAFRERLLPRALEFKPGLVIVSAGFDSREGDPLGRFRLSDGDFGDLLDVLLEVAAAAGKGRLLSVTEGGYSLEGLESAVRAHLGRLGG
jgi:acetoin utilization deacetylase AcuC-like enzyme